MGLSLLISNEDIAKTEYADFSTMQCYSAVWAAHWCLVEAAKEIVPVHDATMLKLYMSSYNHPLTADADDHTAELLASYRDNIEAFCFERIRTTLLNITDWWIERVKQGLPVMFTLVPQACIRPLMQLNAHMGNHNTRPGSYTMDMTPHLTALISSIRNSRVARTTHTSDLSDVGTIAPASEVLKYANAIRTIINNSIAFDAGVINRNRTRENIKFSTQLLSGLLLLCSPWSNTTMRWCADSESTKNIAVTLMRDWFSNDEKFAKIHQLGDLTIAHIFCAELEYLIANGLAEGKATAKSELWLVAAKMLLRDEQIVNRFGEMNC